jgi:hypothetical protein
MRNPIETTRRPVLHEFRENRLRGDGYVNKEDEEGEETSGKKSEIKRIIGHAIITWEIKPLRFGDPHNTFKFPGLHTFLYVTRGRAYSRYTPLPISPFSHGWPLGA